MFDNYVPDVAEYLEAWRKLVEFTTIKQQLENELDIAVAHIYLECTSNKQYFINGRPPAISLIKDSYAIIGNSEETSKLLAGMRETLVRTEKDIATSKAIIKAEEMKLSLFQTMSANARNVTGFIDE